MDAADLDVLCKVSGGRPAKGQVARVGAGVADDDHDAAHTLVQRPVGKQAFQCPSGLVGVGGVGPRDVQLDDGVVTGVALGQQRAHHSADGAVAAQFVDAADGRHHPGRTALQPVVPRGGSPPVDALPTQVLQVVVVVVHADQHLEHRLLGRDPVLQPFGQKADGLFGNPGQSGDPLVAVRCLRGRGQSGQFVAHLGQHLPPLGVDLRLIEPTEPDAARQVADHREAPLSGADQPFQLGARQGRHLRLRGRFGDPSLQQRGDHLEIGREPLLAQERAEHGLFEGGGAGEVVDPVVAENLGQARDELGGQAGPIGVQALQVAVEVFTGAVHAQLGAGVLTSRTVAAQLGDVGEQSDQPDLAVHHVHAGRLQRRPRSEVLGQRLVAGIGVETHQQRGQVCQQLVRPAGRIGNGVAVRQLDPRPGLGRRLGDRSLVLGDRLQPHQGRHRLDLAAGDHQQLFDPAGERGDQHRLHLHRLQHQHGRAGVHLLADRHRGGHHQCRRRGAQHAALVLADPVGDAVDLDQLDGAVRRRHQPEPFAADVQPAVHLVQALQGGLDGARAATLLDRDAEPVRTDSQRGDLVGDAAQLEGDGTADRMLHLGSAAVRGLEQPGDFDRLGVVVGPDGGRDQGDAGVPVTDQAALAPNPVDPARVRPGHPFGADHLGPVEQFEHEALVRGAALDHHGGLTHGAAQPAQRLDPGSSEGDDLGDHRVEVGGDLIALGHSGVDPDTRPRRQVEPGDPAWCGCEVAVGVLRVEPGLHGVAELGRTVGQPVARGHLDLSLDQVELVGDLGDRVLDLQPGVHLEERERAVRRVV